MPAPTLFWGSLLGIRGGNYFREPFNSRVNGIAQTAPFGMSRRYYTSHLMIDLDHGKRAL